MTITTDCSGSGSQQHSLQLSSFEKSAVDHFLWLPSENFVFSDAVLLPFSIRNPIHFQCYENSILKSCSTAFVSHKAFWMAHAQDNTILETEIHYIRSSTDSIQSVVDDASLCQLVLEQQNVSRLVIFSRIYGLWMQLCW